MESGTRLVSTDLRAFRVVPEGLPAGHLPLNECVEATQGRKYMRERRCSGDFPLSKVIPIVRNFVVMLVFLEWLDEKQPVRNSHVLNWSSSNEMLLQKLFIASDNNTLYLF